MPFCFALRNPGPYVEFFDVTEEICCLGLFGPKSRNMIQKISSDDFTSENFKFGTGKNINIHNINVYTIPCN